LPVFLLTDIEGSTQLWEKHQAAMGQALTRHDTILRELTEEYDGRIIKHTGDGIFAVFESGRPLHCALAIQMRFACEGWQPLPAMRVRLAMNAGAAERRGGDYFGPAVNCTARLLPAGWGGQILLTAAAAQSAALPEGASLKDLGHHVLQDLSEPQLIYTLVHPDLPQQTFPPLRSLPLQEHNLPSQPTRFVGREKELAQIQERLGQPDCRLLNLVGPGGIGKTRLALQAATEQIPFFKHGIYFIPLQPIANAELAVPAIAEAIGFTFNGQQPAKTQLLNMLQDKQMLLVLDNFEQVALGGGLLSELLQRAPRLKLVVTSRERLNLAEENCLPVLGMHFPQEVESTVKHANALGANAQGANAQGANAQGANAQGANAQGANALRAEALQSYDAVRLFLENARRICPDFQLVEADQAAMLRICQLLDGMPLGLEMAAAWVRMISLAEIVTEIERSVDFLISPEHGAPERHHSLRAVFDYLWNFLSEEERGVLRRLSLFSGGFAREAANAVAGASLFFLSALVDRALLRENVNGRYEMHELLRQYAAEKLQSHTTEKDQARRAHAGYYAALLQQNESRLIGKGHKTALAQISAEMGNMRLAWQWALATLREDPADPVALATIEQSTEGLFFFYDTRSLFQEGEEMFAQAAAVLDALPPDPVVARDSTTARTSQKRQLLGKILCRQAIFFYHLGFHGRSCDLLQLAVAEARAHVNPVEEALALTIMGSAVQILGHLGRARELFHQAQLLFQESEKSWGLVLCLRFMGNVAYNSGHFEEANRCFSESHALAQQINYQRGVADSLNNLGLVSCSLGNYVLAEQYHRQSLVLYKELSSQKGVALAVNNLAHMSTLMGQYRQAILLYQESLSLQRLHGIHYETGVALKNLGDVALLLGNYAEAEQYYQDALINNEATENQQAIAFAYSNLGDVARARGDYDIAANYYGEARSRMEQLEHGGGLAHVVENVGTLARVQEKYGEACIHYEQSLAIHRRSGNREGIGHLLNQLGVLALAQQSLALAIDYFEQGMATFSEAGVSWGISTSLNYLVESTLRLPDLEVARRHLLAALTLAQQLQAPPLTLQTLLRATAFLDELTQLQPMALPEACERRTLAVALAQLCSCHEAASVEIQDHARALLLTIAQPDDNAVEGTATTPLPDDLNQVVQTLLERLSS
jgi:predicted ATPase/class 3 adenylate cyclase